MLTTTVNGVTFTWVRARKLWVSEDGYFELTNERMTQEAR